MNTYKLNIKNEGLKSFITKNKDNITNSEDILNGPFILAYSESEARERASYKYPLLPVYDLEPLTGKHRDTLALKYHLAWNNTELTSCEQVKNGG